MEPQPNQSKLSAYIEITRAIDGFTMGLGMVVGAIVAGSLELDIPLQFYIVLIISGLLVTSHTMVINDIIDLEIDKINVPERVLPSGKLSILEAYVYSLFLFLFGIFGFVLIDYQKYIERNWVWLFVTFHIVLSDIYSWKLKKTGILGNIVVAYMSYALFLLADLFINGKLTPLPSILGIMSFLISLSREVLKGIMDTEGDAEHGIRTVAVIKGENFAKQLAVLLQLICFVIGGFLFTELIWIGRVGVLICWIMIIYTIQLSLTANDVQRAKKAKTYLLYIPLVYTPFIITNQIMII